MARWRWRSSTAWSKERSSSRSKARLTAPLWPKPRTIWPERGSSPLLPYFCAHRRPERNPTPGSPSTAKLVPFFAATDIALAFEIARRGAALLVVGDETSTQFPKALNEFRHRQGVGMKVNLLVNYGWEWDLAGLKNGGLRSGEVSRLDLIVRWG